MSLRTGLTGGIGSGKSTVADMFASLGAPVIDADEIVHELSQPGQSGYRQIVDAFGDAALDHDGALNRAWLRDRAFNDPAVRQALEDIFHPMVRETMTQWAAGQTAPYCILVVPLLIETGFTDITDRVCVVMADEDIRRQRVRARGLADAQIDAILARQASDDERLAATDDVIDNNGDLEDLRRQVAELDRRYRSMMSR